MSSTPRATLATYDVQKSLLLGREQISILNGITLHVAHGECVAIIGRSGSGKSTLRGIVAGLDTPISGHVFIDGVEVRHMREAQLAFLSPTAGASILILVGATTLICILVAGSVAWRTTQLRPIEVLRYA